MSFIRKVVLITDGSSDIGAAAAKLFAREGATVVIVGTREAKLKSVARCLTELGAETLVIEADVSKDNEADIIVKTTIKKYGRLDVLVNNAGILREASIMTTNFLKTYDQVMNVNMRSAVLVTYFAAPHLIKTEGNIINVSGMAGLSSTVPLNIPYRTSKAAMNHFTRSTALELDPHGVRVNTISPGPVNTSISDSSTKNLERLQNSTALQRLSKPAEIADMILYLASDKGRGITGSNFWRKPPINNIHRNSFYRQFMCFQ